MRPKLQIREEHYDNELGDGELAQILVLTLVVFVVAIAALLTWGVNASNRSHTTVLRKPRRKSDCCVDLAVGPAALYKLWQAGVPLDVESQRVSMKEY